jgi:hypothetical protein
MDLATLTTAARSWIESDPAFLQIIRGYFNGGVYLLAQKGRRRNSEFPDQRWTRKSSS